MQQIACCNLWGGGVGRTKRAKEQASSDSLYFCLCDECVSMQNVSRIRMPGSS